MSTNPEPKNSPSRFESILQLNVPKGREGKHKKIVSELMRHRPIGSWVGAQNPLVGVAGHQREHSRRFESSNTSKRRRSVHLKRRRLPLCLEGRATILIRQDFYPHFSRRSDNHVRNAAESVAGRLSLDSEARLRIEPRSGGLAGRQAAFSQWASSILLALDLFGERGPRRTCGKRRLRIILQP